MSIFFLNFALSGPVIYSISFRTVIDTICQMKRTDSKGHVTFVILKMEFTMYLLSIKFSNRR